MTEEIEPLSLYIRAKPESYAHVLGLYLALNDLYVACGGSGLEFSATDYSMTQEAESLFEQHAGTPFATAKTEIRPIDSHEVPQDIVYQAIQDYSPPEKAAEIRGRLDRRYPRHSFGNIFPYSQSLIFLYSQLQSDHKYPERFTS